MTKFHLNKINWHRQLGVIIGLFLYAVGFTAFLIPNGLVGGGVGGLSTIIFYISDIPVGISNLVINAVLVLIGIRVLGVGFGFNTIFGIVIASTFMLILQYFITEPLIANEPFMNALIGGAFCGTGVGMAIANGANSGGTDIIALIINNYKNIAPGRIILYCDLAIIGSSWFVFHSVEKLVFGYIVMAVVAYAIDLTLNGAKQSYQFMIISQKADLIAKRITNETQRGVTVMDAKGWYSQIERPVLMVIARKTDRTSIMRIIKECDSDAFTSVSKVSAVFGENFDPIRT